jgi:hypothetical protein
VDEGKGVRAKRELKVESWKMKRTKEKAEAENSAQVNKGRGLVSTGIKDGYQRCIRSRSPQAYGR